MARQNKTCCVCGDSLDGYAATAIVCSVACRSKDRKRGKATRVNALEFAKDLAVGTVLRSKQWTKGDRILDGIFMTDIRLRITRPAGSTYTAHVGVLPADVEVVT